MISTEAFEFLTRGFLSQFGHRHPNSRTGHDGFGCSH